MWLRLENVHSIGAAAGGRSLYSLLSMNANGNLKRGFSAAFKGTCIALSQPCRLMHCMVDATGLPATHTQAVGLMALLQVQANVLWLCLTRPCILASIAFLTVASMEAQQRVSSGALP